ncbi:methyltransferase domain-containing protein [Okeania sp.]|uniref:class I SAM-dependent methyltransferase n=1 Tax=Okeania sp. TaxID=3100323 RepID=UPI002B4AC3F7|nr:methyltransferase domain-containing protein [Okeania sp.]MEB3340209.1 methyltransferase domain-containing protein [Okeania sp.]
MRNQINTNWQSEKNDEINFWRNHIATGGGKYQEDYKARFNPDLPLQNHIARYIKKSVKPGSTVKILDAGSGPYTILGKCLADYKLEITAVDALANEYNQILSEFNVIPLVKTELCDVEGLINYFPDNYFDCAHIRNALDHSYDPLLGILQMIDVVKPGGYVLIDTYINEGDEGNYHGLHSWNFCPKNDKFIIWNQQGKSLVVNDYIQGVGYIEEMKVNQGAKAKKRPMFIAIKKTEKTIFESASNFTLRALEVSDSSNFQKDQ